MSDEQATPTETTTTEAAPDTSTSVLGGEAGSSPSATDAANVEATEALAAKEAEGKVPESAWKTALPDEIKMAPSMKTIHDVETLAKNYVNAQKLIGVDKVPIPSRHATEDEMRATMIKLGLPESVDDYKVDVDAQNAKQALGIDLEVFNKRAHELGIFPSQAEKLLKTHMEDNLARLEQEDKEHKIAVENEEAALKKEWGEAFDRKRGEAKSAMVELTGDKDFLKKLAPLDVALQSSIVRAFAAAGEKLFSEGTIRGGEAVGAYTGAKTPEEAQLELDTIMKDPIYYDASHPNHKKLHEEAKLLFEAAYTGKSASRL